MALTPEDVVNKRFQPTKFREGYDQDEVDDFLDEVVVELRRLNQENEELRQKLMAGESRISELQRSGASSSDAAASAPDQEKSVEPEAPVQAAPVAAAPVAATPAPTQGMTYPAPATPEQDDIEASGTNNLLQLARRLHDEHVKEGAEKRDSLIAEGHATAARLVAEAETKQRAQLDILEGEKSKLEQKIDSLRNFEREYRQKLKGYIEGQLHELETSNSGTGGSFASAVAGGDAPEPQTYQGFGG